MNNLRKQTNPKNLRRRGKDKTRRRGRKGRRGEGKRERRGEGRRRALGKGLAKWSKGSIGLFGGARGMGLISYLRSISIGLLRLRTKLRGNSLGNSWRSI